MFCCRWKMSWRLGDFPCLLGW